jgi:hypothetical protein
LKKFHRCLEAPLDVFSSISGHHDTPHITLTSRQLQNMWMMDGDGEEVRREDGGGVSGLASFGPRQIDYGVASPAQAC